MEKKIDRADMENKINIAELLKDCPEGMELDCVMYDNVTLKSVDNNINANYPICIKTKSGFETRLTKYGQNIQDDDAKCTIFPKGKTTWEKFKRPFKDGDILFVKSVYNWVLIYKENKDKKDLYKYAAISDYPNHKYIVSGNCPICWKEEISQIRFATEEEKQKLFKAIKDNGYLWKPETKTLEKLVEPKFKVGDIIQDKDSYKVKIINVCMEDEMYEYESAIAKGIGGIVFDEQDDWELVPVEPKFKVGDRIKQIGNPKCFIIKTIEFDRYVLNNNQFIRFGDEHLYELVPNKFDINTLVPFESRVLVRDDNTEKWKPNFWGFYDIDNPKIYPYECCGAIFAQCIPYEGNEHLLGTTHDCEEFFKTWKE